MRWYVNDTSLQGQFADFDVFEAVLRDLVATRSRIRALKQRLRITRSFPERSVFQETTLRRVVQQSRDSMLRRQVLIWLDRNGPYLDDERLAESDDYFECFGLDVTDSGLGEAARRIKTGDAASTFSFQGGGVDFASTPLPVDHGLPEAPLGTHPVPNCWTIQELATTALALGEPVTDWTTLVQSARERFPNLLIPDAVYQNRFLAREPFDAAIRDRTLALLGHLNTYASDRTPDGAEGARARDVVDSFFTGERALFTGESPTNQRDFKDELTFTDPEDPERTIFAHWHGKISHRVFRLHFEWPMPQQAQRLKILYLGPKITRA